MRRPLGRVDETEQLETLVCGLLQKKHIRNFRQPMMCQPNFRGGESKRGRPQRRGTNLGVFVPFWPVMRMLG